MNFKLLLAKYDLVHFDMPELEFMVILIVIEWIVNQNSVCALALISRNLTVIQTNRNAIFFFLPRNETLKNRIFPF